MRATCERSRREVSIGVDLWPPDKVGAKRALLDVERTGDDEATLSFYPLDGSEGQAITLCLQGAVTLAGALERAPRKEVVERD